MTKHLFDRLFRQPPTVHVLPAENMATEITAYLLEHHPPFLAKFLQHLGIETAENWEVETQCGLTGPLGTEWRNKIPDIILRHRDPAICILVEVKIDAGVTFSLSSEGGLIPQTQCYQAYLHDLRSKDECLQTRLAVLTRWSPPALCGDAIQLRFQHIAQWLTDDASSADHDPAVAWLGKQWSDFLYAQRWAMKPISKAHIAAVGPFLELQSTIRDTLNAATDAVLVRAKNWQRVGKASDSFKTNEIYFASAYLAHRGRDTDRVQAAIYLGVEKEVPFVQPGVYIANPTLDYLSHFPEYPQEAVPAWNGYRIKLPNLGIDQSEGSDPWSRVVAQYLDFALRLDKALVASKEI